MASSPETFAQGDLVVYQDSLYIVVDILSTHLGNRSYEIQHIESGETKNVGKHALQKPNIQDLQLDEINWEGEMDLSLTEPTHEDSSDKDKSTRHVTMNEHEMDEIVNQCLSANSKKQTKWAVTLLKGMYY